MTPRPLLRHVRAYAGRLCQNAEGAGLEPPVYAEVARRARRSADLSRWIAGELLDHAREDLQESPRDDLARAARAYLRTVV